MSNRRNYSDVVLAVNGDAVTGAMVAVLTDSGAPAVIYASKTGSTPIADGRLVTDFRGGFSFWYQTGQRLQIVVSHDALSTPIVREIASDVTPPYSVPGVDLTLLAGDGRGGRLYYSPGSMATPDGVIVMLPDGVSTEMPGRVLRDGCRPDGSWSDLPVSPRWWGAKGDGRTEPVVDVAAGSDIVSSRRDGVWSPEDVGKHFYLQGGGANDTPLTGTIVEWIDSRSIRISTAAVSDCPRWALGYTNRSLGARIVSPGQGYAPGDVVDVVGGASVESASYRVDRTTVVSATVAAGGTRGENGRQTVTGTTGTTATGMMFRAVVTIEGGAIVAVESISFGGNYRVNPTDIASEPVTGAGLVGARLAVTMGVRNLAQHNPGVYLDSYFGVLTQAGSSGTGTGLEVDPVSFQSRGRMIWYSDDAPAFAACFAFATANSCSIEIDDGAYALVSQTDPLPINRLSVRGSGLNGKQRPANLTGATLLIFNDQTPAFSDMEGVSWDGVHVYYPLQDGSRPDPVPYPPLFESTSWGSGSFTNSNFCNPYITWRTWGAGASSIGKVVIDRVRTYGIHAVFAIDNGTQDILELGPGNYFGVGAADGVGRYGPANLARYTRKHGSVFRIDIGNGAHDAIEGLTWTGGLCQGYACAIRVVSGRFTLGRFANVNFDGTPQVLRVTGDALVSKLSFAACSGFCLDIFDPEAAADVFYFSTTSIGNNLQIEGFKLNYASGSFFRDDGDSIDVLNITGGTILNIGRSETPGVYSGVHVLGNRSGSFTITGVTIECERSNVPHSTFYGFSLGLGPASVMSITGNTVKSATRPLRVQAGAGGTCTMSGNTSVGSLADWTDGGNSRVIDSNNAFDVPSEIHHVGNTTSVSSVAAADSGLRDEAPVLVSAHNYVQAAADQAAVRLARPKWGMEQHVTNDAAVPIALFGNSISDLINGATDAFVVPPGRVARCIARTDAEWKCMLYA